MSKSTKAWIIVATFLILTGVILFGGAMTVMGWNFSNLLSAKAVTNEHVIGEDFTDISIITDTADVIISYSDDGACRVICDESKDLIHSVSAADGVLKIELIDTRKWHTYLFNFHNPKIQLYLPLGEYGSLLIKGHTGNIEISSDLSFTNADVSATTGDILFLASVANDVKITATTGNILAECLSAEALALAVTTGKVNVSSARLGDLSIKVSTGKTELNDISCENLAAKGNTGDILMNNVIASGKIDVERSTGDVKFENCDATEIFAKTDTGNINGSLLSDKIFIIETDTGRVSVPKSTNGGRCELTTDTGDIKITIKQ